MNPTVLATITAAVVVGFGIAVFIVGVFRTEKTLRDYEKFKANIQKDIKKQAAERENFLIFFPKDLQRIEKFEKKCPWARRR